MRNPLHTPLGAVFHNEVRLNSQRMAPYALLILFTAHSILWWGWSAAATYGWAVNSDYNIIRNLLGFSMILGLPIFNAMIMGDPVIRDFRAGIDPLIFSKPISRAGYLLGKFCGNFFVLVCCQTAFVLTMFLLQWFPSTWVITGPIRGLSYFKHFLLIVVISHLILAAVYFAVGTLTRKATIVYFLAGAFYPLYIGYQLFLLRHLPASWRIMLDLFVGNSFQIPPEKYRDPAWVNQLVITYSPVMYANRALMIGLAVLCLAIVYLRFSVEEKTDRAPFSILNLSTRVAGLDSDSTTAAIHFSAAPCFRDKSERALALPVVAKANAGRRSDLSKLLAAVKVEFQLLRAEKSLIVLMPLTLLLAFIALPFSATTSGASYSAAYAAATTGLVLFLIGVIVFYTGEAMQRDRETKVEPILWSTPAPNSVLLLSKFLAIFLLALALVVIIGLTAIGVQFLRSHRPVEISAYLVTYTVILLPSIAFVAAASLALNIMLRNKYLAYTISIATAGGLSYLYNLGYNHWLYNPLLYRLWTYSDLTNSQSFSRILLHRVYVLSFAVVFLGLAHLGCQRRSRVRRARN